ncbi:MAG: DNA topoisomerase (ATP-hydrolyzing) [Gemmataceae bacterium]
MAEDLIHPASIVEETRRRYLTYALSVISARALPDVRDGLKPVQRRILYCMDHELLLRADRRPAKCARIVGDVMGKYHPHGDKAIYDALVRMAQPWVMRETLVDGMGNFGSFDGDNPAAYRYTEAKLTPIADHLLAELRQKTVDMRPTYNGETEEPVVLPAQFPNLLVNGSSGIAVGMATNIPPHNLGEVVEASIALIEDADATTTNLMKYVKGPDFPLGGQIMTDKPTLRRIYEEGQGSIRVQAEWKTERTKRGEQIVVTSIPHNANKAQIEATIGEIIANRKLPQLLSCSNESNEKDGLRIAMEIKPGADPNLIMSYLFKHTALQDNFAVNLTCLVPDEEGHPQPQRLGLREILRHFLDFRFATVKRRFEYELEQLKKRIHILTGFRIVFNALDRAIKLIRESQGKQDAAQKLMKEFDLDDIQTDAILDSQLYKIAQMEIKKILDELREKKKQAEEIEEILASKRKLWKVVRDELAALAEKYPGKRRTKFGGEELPEYDEKAFIVKENTNVVLTKDGWISRVGRLASVEGTRTREGTASLPSVPPARSTTSSSAPTTAPPTPCRSTRFPASPATVSRSPVLQAGDNVRIVAAFATDKRFLPEDHKGPTKEDPAGPYFLVVTAHGLTLRAPLAPYLEASNKLGRRYVKLNEGDRVVMVEALKKEDENASLFLASRDGHVLHFAVKEINILAGVGKGVIGIKLADEDECIGGALIRRSDDRLVVETTGGKNLEFTGRYEVVSRAGKGFEAVKRADLVRVIPPPITLVDWEQLEAGGNGKAGRNGQGGLFE